MFPCIKSCFLENVQFVVCTFMLIHNICVAHLSTQNCLQLSAVIEFFLLHCLV